VTDELCIHDLTPESCTICLHGVEDKPTLTIAHQFRARYDGDCWGCDFPIRPGQQCYRLSNESNVHRGCEPVGTSF
jgi:hypothetical protein